MSKVRSRYRATRALFITTIILSATPIIGCSEGEYCGHSNDDCVTGASCILNNITYHSCGICACIPVETLTIAVNSDSLTDATVGVAYTNQIQITASGGIKPYHWVLVVDEAYLDLLNWLQIEDGTDNGNPAVLTNKPNVFPNQSSSDAIRFKVHVLDDSIKGSKNSTNNKGVGQEVTIKINPGI